MGILYLNLKCKEINMETFIFTTENIPEEDRFRCWVKEISHYIHREEILSISRHNFQAQIESASFGLLALTSFIAPQATFYRSAEMLKYEAQFRYHLILNRAGKNILHQDNRSAVSGIGDLVLVDSARISRSIREDVTNMRIISLSEAFVNQWVPQAEDCTARTIKGDHGWGAILSTYINQLDISLLQSAFCPSEQFMIADHIGALMDFSFRQFTNTETDKALIKHSTHRDDLHQRMVLWLREHYRDADIAAQTVADAFGMSLRNVHKVFALGSPGCSFLDTLQSIRIEAAIKLLEKNRSGDTPLSEIAWLCGFTDPTQFSRIFRQYKSISPKKYSDQLHIDYVNSLLKLEEITKK